VVQDHAIVRVRSLVEETVRQVGVALAESLDITNGFNSLPWGKIGEALEFHQVPSYLQGVVRVYLRDRYIVYTSLSGEVIRSCTAVLRSLL
jgi:hypothetical protein